MPSSNVFGAIHAHHHQLNMTERGERDDDVAMRRKYCVIFFSVSFSLTLIYGFFPLCLSSCCLFAMSNQKWWNERWQESKRTRVSHSSANLIFNFLLFSLFIKLMLWCVCFYFCRLERERFMSSCLGSHRRVDRDFPWCVHFSIDFNLFDMMLGDEAARLMGLSRETSRLRFDFEVMSSVLISTCIEFNPNYL